MDSFTSELANTLCQTFSTDTLAIRAATSSLKTGFLNKPESFPSLVAICTMHPEWQVRQLAAVEARKSVKKHWLRLNASTRKTLKEQLLSSIVNEQNSLTRHSIARVISSIAQIDIPNGHWKDLMQFLYQCCESPMAGHREVGVYVLFTLYEVIADHMEDHVQQLFSLFAKTIEDSESYQVRLITLQALGKVSEFIDPTDQRSCAQLKALVPKMVAVLQVAMEQKDEDGAAKGFEVFETLLVLELPVLNQHLSELVMFFLNVCGNVQLDDSLRMMALSFIMWSTIYKKSKLAKLKLVSPIISTVLQIASEEEDEDQDDDEDSPIKVALQVLNSLGTSLPPQQVFPIVAEHISQFMQSGNPNLKKAAMLGLCVVIDGSVDYLRSRIKDVLTVIAMGLQDSENIVKKAACMTFSQLAEELGSEMVAEHANLMPLIDNLLNDPNSEIQRHSTIALDSILESLGAEIVPYLPSLMHKLVNLVDNGPVNNKATVVGAIGSAAHAASTNFSPYFSAVATRLQQMMNESSSEEALLLRGVATDVMSSLAEAVGKDVFRPYLAQTMQLALQGLELSNSRLAECTFIFFANISAVFEQEFAPFLPVVLQHLMRSLNASEAVQEEQVEEVDIDEDDDEEEQQFRVNSSITEEKEIAASSLGTLFMSTKQEFMPWLSETFTCLLELADHFNYEVRKSAIGSLFQYVHAFFDMSQIKWTPGQEHYLNEQVAQMVKMVMDVTLKTLDSETDRIIVVQIIQEINEALKHVGPDMLLGNKNRFMQSVRDIFEINHLCQQDEYADDEIEQGEMAEHDSLLINAAAEAISATAIANGPGFAQLFAEFYPFLEKYYSPNFSCSERSMCVGSMAETIQGLKEGVASFTERMFVLFSKALQDPEEEVKSNAAFAMGVLCQYTPADISSHSMQILQLLYPLFSHNATLSNMVDNACGAVARIITRAKHSLPLDHIVPVLLEFLPLRSDFEEYEPVFNCLIGLIKEQQSSINMTRFFSVTAKAVDHLKPELKAELSMFIKTIKDSNPSVFDGIVGSLEGQEQSIISGLLI